MGITKTRKWKENKRESKRTTENKLLKAFLDVKLSMAGKKSLKSADQFLKEI